MMIKFNAKPWGMITVYLKFRNRKYTELIRQLKSFTLPLVIIIIIPLFLLFLSPDYFFLKSYFIMRILIGCIFITLGILILGICIRFFLDVGKGTLAPWDPPKKLIQDGPYSYTRNPMITGVLSTLAGEAILFGSFFILVWFLLCFVINDIYFRKFEEPELERKFGREYAIYKKEVPRWFPKIK